MKVNYFISYKCICIRFVHDLQMVPQRIDPKLTILQRCWLLPVVKRLILTTTKKKKRLKKIQNCVKTLCEQKESKRWGWEESMCGYSLLTYLLADPPTDKLISVDSKSKSSVLNLNKEREEKKEEKHVSITQVNLFRHETKIIKRATIC